MPKSTICVVSLTLMMAGCVPSPRIAHRVEMETLSSLLADAVSIETIQASGTLVIEHQNQSLRAPLKMFISSERNLTVEADFDEFWMLPRGSILVKSDSFSTEIVTALGLIDPSATGLKQDEIHFCLLAFFGGIDLLLPLFQESGCSLGREIVCGNLTFKLGFKKGFENVTSWEISLPNRFNIKARIASFDIQTDRPVSTIAVVYPNEIVLRMKFDSIEIVKRP